MDISGKTAIITGGASGLGAATAEKLHGLGANVLIADFNAATGQAMAQKLGARALFAQVDVTNTEQVQAAVRQAMEAFGAIHILVNCAGTAVPMKIVGKTGPHDLNAFIKIVHINLIGTFDAMRLAAFEMQNNTPDANGERGVIVNTASVAAFEGQVGQSAYAASKAGVAGLTICAARDMANIGIRVCTIAPGLFDTPLLAALPEEARISLGKQTPFPPRLGQPKEFAMLATAIIENPMMNGETVRLDGAIRMAPR